MQDRCKVDVVSMWGWCRVDVGSMWSWMEMDEMETCKLCLYDSKDIGLHYPRYSKLTLAMQFSIFSHMNIHLFICLQVVRFLRSRGVNEDVIDRFREEKVKFKQYYSNNFRIGCTFKGKLTFKQAIKIRRFSFETVWCLHWQP